VSTVNLFYFCLSVFGTTHVLYRQQQQVVILCRRHLQHYHDNVVWRNTCLVQ